MSGGLGWFLYNSHIEGGFDMNVKTLVLGIVMGGMVSFGTYFFLPAPQSVSASSDCATSQELLVAVSSIKRHITNEINWSH